MSFNHQNFVFQVVIQAKSQLRNGKNSIHQLYIRGTTGAVVKLNSLVKITTVQRADAVNADAVYPSC